MRINEISKIIKRSLWLTPLGEHRISFQNHRNFVKQKFGNQVDYSDFNETDKSWALYHHAWALGWVSVEYRIGFEYRNYSDINISGYAEAIKTQYSNLTKYIKMVDNVIIDVRTPLNSFKKESYGVFHLPDGRGKMARFISNL